MAWTVAGVSTRAGFPVAVSSGIWALGPSARAASTSGLRIRSASLLAGVGMGSTLDHRQRVGDEQRSELAGLPIRVDDRHRAAGLDLTHRVVGVGQSEGDLARADGRGHLLVAREDLDPVGLEVLEELPGLLLPPGREQAGGLRGRRAEERLGDADLALPLRIQQIRQPVGSIGLGNEPWC